MNLRPELSYERMIWMIIVNFAGTFCAMIFLWGLITEHYMMASCWGYVPMVVLSYVMNCIKN